jgi:hypothetical protein
MEAGGPWPLPLRRGDVALPLLTGWSPKSLFALLHEGRSGGASHSVIAGPVFDAVVTFGSAI